MLILKRILILLVLFSISFNSFSKGIKGGGKALIIIDMQPYFAERGGNIKKGDNAKKLKTIVQTQIEAIEMAKKAGIPIVFIEYEDSGKTDGALKNAVGNYKRTETFIKNTDGMFSKYNKNKDKLEAYLEREKVKDLIITGANGGACVHWSINGSLDEDYNVIAFSKGIADFNYKEFIYPYDDKYNFKPNCKDCSFREVDELHEVGIIMSSGTKKDESGKKINDSGRDSELSDKALPSTKKVRKGSRRISK